MTHSGEKEVECKMALRLLQSPADLGSFLGPCSGTHLSGSPSSLTDRASRPGLGLSHHGVLHA
ncbi:hypothetical protein P7K49_002330 [Saguinus oedipus]|uniref:Uncharacterized protein n=1 Tax=Saguinus oedipus TaxID=9490 RepID=A0ABQ9WH27_SAGOE|nr:hypothetical protein P7K49_002330 [Saguinus oedipus]